jgi:tripeptidyl-peptidase-1
MNYTTLDCLRESYNIPTSAAAYPKNSFGIVTLTSGACFESDLEAFFGIFAQELVGQQPILESIHGGALQDTWQAFRFSGEASLDFEYAMGLSHPLNIICYQVGDMSIFASLGNFLSAIDRSYCSHDHPIFDSIYPSPNGYDHSADCGKVAATKVISVSYTSSEMIFTETYAKRQCLEYLKLGLQGITVLFASGDYGVVDSYDQCIDPTSGTANDGLSGNFSPSFPASRPYITAVRNKQLPGGNGIRVQRLHLMLVYQMFGLHPEEGSPTYFQGRFIKRMP